MSRTLLRRILFTASVGLLPYAASAATSPTDLKSLAKVLVDLINIAIPVLISLGVVYYLWGIAYSIKDAGSAKSWANFRTQIAWGILALFMMVSIWGILRLLDNTFFTGVPPT